MNMAKLCRGACVAGCTAIGLIACGGCIAYRGDIRFMTDATVEGINYRSNHERQAGSNTMTNANTMEGGGAATIPASLTPLKLQAVPQ